jgi:hypothetical protein
MSEELKDGGPAFPTDSACQIANTAWHFEGMTLRDYFAAKVAPEIYARVESGGFERVAKLAYDLADAMLQARKS